jgi:Na+/melibiose symporter-like transporter
MNLDRADKQKVNYAFGNFGNGVYNGFNNAILGLYILAFTSNPFLIGYLSNTRTMEGVILQPLAGKFSDQMSSPLGRRRPFILVFIPLAVFFLALVPVMAQQPHARALPLIVASIILFSINWNLAGDPYQALMIDITKPEERPTYNAILSVVSLVGQVVILLYATVATLNKHNIPNPVFYACVGFLFLSYTVVFFGVREPKNAQETAQVEQRIPLRVYLQEMRTFKEAFKLLLSIFFLWSGLNAIIPYLTVFTHKEMHVSDSKAIIVYLAVILTAGIFAYPFGRLAARFGMQRLIIFGTVLLILAAILGTLAPTYITLFPVAILAGCGFSATTALTYPYLAQLVPESRIGVFTGLQAAFSSVALPLSVAVTATLIHFFGYRSIFVMLAVMMVFDVILLLSVDNDTARKQVESVTAAERAVAPQAPAPAV